MPSRCCRACATCSPTATSRAARNATPTRPAATSTARWTTTCACCSPTRRPRVGSCWPATRRPPTRPWRRWSPTATTPRGSAGSSTVRPARSGSVADPGGGPPHDELRLPLDGDHGDGGGRGDEGSARPAPDGDPRAQLPSLTLLLHRSPAQDAIARFGREAYLGALRATLDLARTAAAAGGPVPSADAVHGRALARLEAVEAARTTRVLNATGVVLHTNLGRAPLSAAATSALGDAAGTVDVELDLATGQRSSRGRRVADELASMCGAEAAAVVNNGAAALVLAVAALARGREVIVSRGELVEIGGSFRLPDLLVAAGVVLREVGTTNRTHVRDYTTALGPDTAMLLRVHPSNYRVEGYAGRPAAAELAEVARQAGVPFVHDLGSGLLRPAPELDPDEPSATEAIADGADLVLFSGDKLLGGPQAGILLGRAPLVEACRREPLARAMRVDKSRLAALEATVAVHRRGTLTELPTWAMLRADADDLRARAERYAAELGGEVVAVAGTVGGGSFPGTELPGHGVALPAEVGGADEVAAKLRAADPPVLARIVDDRVILDPRTVPPDRDEQLIDAVLAVL
ncbi:L-seryl-tRNA(Sec) selenium transferase [Nitriliruptoraceae bacterium ZYF776]|nr:L-seryl-tRNA(Sec) selenium transferase [Profundirhabdus halotolerans]